MSLILKEKAAKAKQLFTEVGTIATAIAAIGTAYFLYMNNVWKPSVTLVSADWANGVATVTVNGDTVTLYKNEKYNCGWGWDVEFGVDYEANIERVQLVKNLSNGASVVNQVLSVKS